MEDKAKYLPRTKLGNPVSPNWSKEHIDLVQALEDEMGYAVCGARTTSVSEDGRPCRHRAGYGTEHEGEGRCKYHGGASRIKHGAYSPLRHYDLATRVDSFFENPELMNIKTAVATSWAAIDTALEEDAYISPERAQEIVQAMGRIGVMIKQHHDITEGQKIMIEVPQFMEWAETMYELAIKYIQQAGGDVRGFLAEAEQYYSGAVAIVTGISTPALGTGDSVEAEGLLRSGVEES